MPFKIIIADDHPIIRNGIKDLLEKEESFEFLAGFEDGKTLLHSSKLAYADVLLLDLNLPHTDGLQVLKEIKTKDLNLKVIVLTAYVSQKLSEECKEFGASAYLVKTQSLNNLTEIINKVMKGEVFFTDMGADEENIDNCFFYFDKFLVKYKLTKREVEVIKMISQGYTSSEIAEHLSLSPFTIQTHRKNIFKKLSLEQSNNVGLINFAIKNGII